MNIAQEENPSDHMFRARVGLEIESILSNDALGRLNEIWWF